MKACACQANCSPIQLMAIFRLVKCTKHFCIQIQPKKESGQRLKHSVEEIKTIIIIILPLKSRDFNRMDRMYTTCSTLATDSVLVSILQSPEPHWRAQTCTQGVVHTAGGTSSVRGEGEVANQRSVYTTRNFYTHKKPSGGVSSPNPRHAKCLARSH